ncbi:MAG: hypothetical protein HQK91_12055 [Nitrospirae bacterium]|nr:hypothetical protein [Nitrospirota bacterium]
MKSTKKRDLIIAIAFLLILNCCLIGIGNCASGEPDQNTEVETNSEPEIQSTLSSHSPFHPFTCCVATDNDTYTMYQFDNNLKKYACRTEFIKTRIFYNKDKLKHSINNYYF